MKSRSVFLACSVFLALTSVAQARKWTDVNGNQISAEYVRIHEGEVILKQGSRLLKCPYDQFSELDKAYIREQMAAESEKRRPVGVHQIGGPVESEASDDARELRTWRDALGRKVLAQYAGFSGGRVELIKDGQRTAYSYSAFSPMDQAYVDRILIEEGRADEIPKKQNADEGSGGGERSSDGGSGRYEMGNSYSPPQYEDSNADNDGGSYENSGSYGSGSMEMEHEASYDDMSSSSEYDSGGSSGSANYNSGVSGGPGGWSPPQPQLVMKKKCMKCNGIVPDSTTVGDRCPHCGVTFGYEVGADGNRTSTGESWRTRRLVIRLVGLGFTVLLVLGGFMARR